MNRPLPLLRTAPCAHCVALRRHSLGASVSPDAELLAAPGCGCQDLPAPERLRRLVTPGLGPIAEAIVAQTPLRGLWVAVVRGADARPFGAAADLALGLGIGPTREAALARATGEALERYGSAIVPAEVGAEVPLFDATGRPAGAADPARVYLPFHRDGVVQLPARSDGLAFAFSRTRALRAAREEWLERHCLARLHDEGPDLAQALPRRGADTVAGFLLSEDPAVVLALWPDPRSDALPPIASGAACRKSLPAAWRAAWREAALSRMVAAGAVLPGAGLEANALLGPLGRLPFDAWRGRASPPSAPRDLPGFADLTPGDIRQAGGHVLRALSAKEP